MSLTLTSSLASLLVIPNFYSIICSPNLAFLQDSKLEVEDGAWSQKNKSFFLYPASSGVIFLAAISNSVVVPEENRTRVMFYTLSSGIGTLSNLCDCILWLTDTDFSSGPEVLYYFVPPGNLLGRVLTWFKMKKNILPTPFIYSC